MRVAKACTARANSVVPGGTDHVTVEVKRLHVGIGNPFDIALDVHLALQRMPREQQRR